MAANELLVITLDSSIANGKTSNMTFLFVTSIINLVSTKTYFKRLVAKYVCHAPTVVINVASTCVELNWHLRIRVCKEQKEVRSIKIVNHGAVLS